MKLWIGPAVFVAWSCSVMLMAAADDLPKLLKKAKAGDPEAMAQVAARYYDDKPELPMDEARLFEYASKAAAKGVPLGDAMLARCYRRAIGTKRDPDKSFVHAQKAAGRCPEGWTVLGSCYEVGVGVPKDHEKAREVLRQAYEAGDPIGSAGYAAFLFRGRGVGHPPDPVAAGVIFEALLEQEHSTAGSEYARCLLVDNTSNIREPKDDKKIEALLERALVLNPRNGEALYLLANLLIARDRDDDRAVSLLLRGMRLGSSSSMETLVWRSQSGIDVTSRAMYSLAKAAYEKGDRSRLVVHFHAYSVGLGDDYGGHGVPADVKKGIAIAEETVRSGNREGYYTLGWIYWRTPKPDYRKAIDCFVICSGAEPAAAGYIGEIIMKGGKAFEGELPKAWAALKTAEERGWDDAAGYLAKLEPQLGPEQLALARDLKAKNYPRAEQFQQQALKDMGLQEAGKN